MKKPFLFLAFSLATVAMASAAPLKIVASFLPLYAHVKTIGGDRVEVVCLARNGVDPHDFAPKPSDLKAIAGADLLVVNGLGMESWLDGVIKEAASTKLVFVDSSWGIAPKHNPTYVKVPGLPKGEDQDVNGVNPHAWLDPVLAQQQVRTILAMMDKFDPADAPYFDANAKAYLAQIAALDVDFLSLFTTLSAGSMNLVTFHDAFPYFAARYGLNYLGSIEEFPEKAPSPQALAHLVDLIKAHHVKVLFAEKGYEPKLLRTIAEQTGATVAELDTIEVGEPVADAYLVRMQANLDALRKAWSN